MVLLESLKLEMGTSVIDFNLPATDGKNYSLADFSDSKMLVVVFMCNHCPYVQAIWDRLVKLQDQFVDQGVQFVGINSNLNPSYEEETFEKMKEYFDRYNMNFPYLQDASQDVAREYKAQCTPDIYVFNTDRKLAYHGRIDDNWQDESAVTKHELAKALEAIVDGGLLEEQYPSIGCSIKWRD